MSLPFPGIHLSSVVHLDKAKTTSNFHRCPINPRNTGDVHPSVQRDTTGRVDKVENLVDIVHLPSHLLVRVRSRSAHRQGELGVVVGEREGHRLWRGNDAHNLWRVGDLEPESLAFGRVVGLEQELHRIHLCDNCSIYAPWNVTPKRESKRTFAGMIPGLVPVQGGNRIRGKVGKER